MTTVRAGFADGHVCRHRVAVVSGYFNPLHVGHVRMIEGAAALADHLVVVVNNDEQQLLKKGRIIIPLDQRLEVVAALRAVDVAVASIDTDPSIRRTLGLVREIAPHSEMLFANGGDRGNAGEIAESDACAALDISLVFGIGGNEKTDSSTRIHDALSGA